MQTIAAIALAVLAAIDTAWPVGLAPVVAEAIAGMATAQCSWHSQRGCMLAAVVAEFFCSLDIHQHSRQNYVAAAADNQ